MTCYVPSILMSVWMWPLTSYQRDTIILYKGQGSAFVQETCVTGMYQILTLHLNQKKPHREASSVITVATGVHLIGELILFLTFLSVGTL